MVHAQFEEEEREGLMIQMSLEEAIERIGEARGGTCEGRERTVGSGMLWYGSDRRHDALNQKQNI